ncbi:hypothetical protein O5284_19130 [Escherichia coli]|uniref:hypothetical protein n=1 Tax=Escherichia coli TaxID=562 RepID=UPI00208ED13C|nr:hypothetical protein [Escherichia coli]MCZ5597050.1 hypothetical protein [Escherichia coli]MCZ5820118.1 hypothetical protein [Escherichia coli]
MSIKNDGHYFCRAGGNRPDGLNEPVTLNGDATPNIRTMSNKKIECLEKSEVEWASRVCDSITDKERENLKALICSKPAKSVNTGKRPALGY